MTKKKKTSLYGRVRKKLTSPEAKQVYKDLKITGRAVGNYFNAVNNNIDQTFSIPKRKPDYTLTNKVYIPKGYKLVKTRTGYKLVKKY